MNGKKKLNEVAVIKKCCIREADFLATALQKCSIALGEIAHNEFIYCTLDLILSLFFSTNIVSASNFMGDFQLEKFMLGLAFSFNVFKDLLRLGYFALGGQKMFNSVNDVIEAFDEFRIRNFDEVTGEDVEDIDRVQKRSVLNPSM